MSSLYVCPRDTNRDGDCGQVTCPHCSFHLNLKQRLRLLSEERSSPDLPDEDARKRIAVGLNWEDLADLIDALDAAVDLYEGDPRSVRAKRAKNRLIDIGRTYAT